MNKNSITGIAFALLAAFISGLSVFYNKLVLVKGIDPLIFNIIKNSCTAIIIFLFFIANSEFLSFGKITKKQLLSLVIIGIVGGSIPFVLFFEGLKLIPATNANIIHKSMFVWTALLALPILKEKLNLWQITGYLMVIWSNFFLGGLTSITFGTGELLIFTATLFWAVENIVVKISLKDTDYKIIALGRMLFGSFILILIAVFQNRLSLISGFPAISLLPFFVSALFLAAYLLSFFKALSKTSVTAATSVLILAAPITNILTSAFIEHNRHPFPNLPTIITLTGILFITGTYISSKITKYISIVR